MVLFLAAVLVLSLAACGRGAPHDGAGDQARDDVLTPGAALYTANCQVCHGDREGQGRRGETPPHNEEGHTWHHPDTQLNDWVLNGKFPGAMPAFGHVLTEEEVVVILDYIKTWWTEEQRASQADVSKRYQEALELSRGE